MIVSIINFEEHEPDHLAACMKHIKRHFGDSLNDETPETKVFCNKRDVAGWIEYGIKYPTMWVGVIQRTPGAEIECHS